MVALAVLIDDDLTPAGCDQYFADDPLAIAAELEQAADQGRLAGSPLISASGNESWSTRSR